MLVQTTLKLCGDYLELMGPKDLRSNLLLLVPIFHRLIILSRIYNLAHDGSGIPDVQAILGSVIKVILNVLESEIEL